MTIYSDPLLALAAVGLRQVQPPGGGSGHQSTRSRTSHRQSWFLRSRVRPALRPAHRARAA